jgi:hypothetical protein
MELDFYEKNQLIIFIIICAFIFYLTKFIESGPLLNTIIIISIIYYIFYKDILPLNKKNENKDKSFIHKYPNLYAYKEKIKVISSFNEQCYDDIIDSLNKFIKLYERIKNKKIYHKYNYDTVFSLYQNIVNLLYSSINSISPGLFYKSEPLEDYIQKYTRVIRLDLYSKIQELNTLNVDNVNKNGYTIETLINQDDVLPYDTGIKKDNNFRVF